VSAQFENTRLSWPHALTYYLLSFLMSLMSVSASCTILEVDSDPKSSSVQAGSTSIGTEVPEAAQGKHVYGLHLHHQRDSKVSLVSLFPGQGRSHPLISIRIHANQTCLHHAQTLNHDTLPRRCKRTLNSGSPPRANAEPRHTPRPMQTRLT
jgi:hypothetical protein